MRFYNLSSSFFPQKCIAYFNTDMTKFSKEKLFSDCIVHFAPIVHFALNGDFVLYKHFALNIQI